MSKFEGEHAGIMKVKLVLLRTVDVDHLNIAAFHTIGNEIIIISPVAIYFSVVMR